MENANIKERYDNIDGLRALSCIAIIAMHIRANAGYQMNGLARSVISSWSLLVYLFLLISGFGMFCGYYERFRNGSADLDRFYKKRYQKILPFFAFLIVLDLIMERSASHLIEGLTEATMLFGLLPNNQLSVIGVSWTLGVIFLFYMLFPFFVWALWDKKRAWGFFIISIVIAVFCDIYYFTGEFVVESFAPRHSFLYCMPYFAAGGMVYLYRDKIKALVSRFRWPFLALCVAVTVLYYAVMRPRTSMEHVGPLMLIVFLPWLFYAIGANSRVLNNRVMKYLGGISMEMYLAQMVVFRVAEKAGLLYLFGKGMIGFIISCIIVVLGLILLTEAWRRVCRLVKVEKRAKV